MISNFTVQEMKKITGKFVEDYLLELLNNLRPDLTFEYFSKYTDAWNIKITNNTNELLGEYQNGDLISGKWYDDNKEDMDMVALHKTLKVASEKANMPFYLYLNKLLCKSKQNGGISWKENESIVYIERGI